MSDISAGELEYMEQHPNADRAPGIIACGVICLSFAVAAVSMRLISRRMVGLSFGLDDYTILLALILYIAFTTFLILTTRFGMGKHIIYISSAKWLTISITVAEALYVLSIMTVKCAILMFYRRIFPQKWFHNCIWVMVALVISYNISSFFATILQCVPVRHQWDTSVPATCIDYFAVVVYAGVFNVVTDFMILGMPIPLILKLQVSKNKKRGLIIVFSWGIAACVVSIARTIKASALTSVDSSWDLAGALYATTLEVCMGLISACVPTLRPFMSRFWNAIGDPKIFTTQKTRSKSLVLPTWEESMKSSPGHRRDNSFQTRSSSESHILKDQPSRS